MSCNMSLLFTRPFFQAWSIWERAMHTDCAWSHKIAGFSASRACCHFLCYIFWVICQLFHFGSTASVTRPLKSIEIFLLNISEPVIIAYSFILISWQNITFIYLSYFPKTEMNLEQKDKIYQTHGSVFVIMWCPAFHFLVSQSWLMHFNVRNH